jgi:thiol-disulfide isomerase/thioredoxin
MKNRVARRWAALVLGVGTWIALAATAPGADRSAEQILKELDAVTYPTFGTSRRQNQDYIREYETNWQKARDRRPALILELYKVAPDHERIPVLMSERWGWGDDSGLFKEIDAVLAHTKNPKLKIEGALHKARVKLDLAARGASPDVPEVEEFLKFAPKDPRGALLLSRVVPLTRDQRARADLEDRIVRQFPDTYFARAILGVRRRPESIGKPVELAFTDAIKGSPVSIKNLKGKVVVIDFWATWCGPCVAEMPKMKELYAQYHDQGVEFIGVSLDQPKEKGGLDSLKKFIKENEIPWPQYYQGNYWESEFSTSWGINSIPRMFVVDQEGKLYSVEARGKLDTIIPELLKKKGGSPGSA